jgi:hypothetical protein
VSESREKATDHLIAADSKIGNGGGNVGSRTSSKTSRAVGKGRLDEFVVTEKVV